MEQGRDIRASDEDVGIAVCTYRRPAGLGRLLAALPMGCAGRRAPTVFVVDNDGTDPDVARVVAEARAATGWDIRLFVEPRPGISAARNRAFAEAEAAGLRWLAMLDDDEWPREGWLAALVERQRETGAAVVSGIVRPRFPARALGLEPYRRFWSVEPQTRAGRDFVHASSNFLIDLKAVSEVPRPLFQEAHGLSGGGDLVFFSRLFDLGLPMAWAGEAVAVEAVPEERASWDWLRRRRFRVGNHMVMDEELRHGRWRPMLKTAGLALRLAVYPLFGREPEAPLAGWRMEAAKLRGRVAAHRGLRAFEYCRDGVSLRRAGEAGSARPLRGKRRPWRRGKGLHRCPFPTIPARVFGQRRWRREEGGGGPAPAAAAVGPERVIVGIPALNEERHIERCIRGIIGGDPWMRRVRVLVADGGSSDRTEEIVRRLAREFPNLGLAANWKRVQSAGMNLVAEAAGPGQDFLVRCDAHADYPPGYVRGAAERLAALDPETAVLATVMDARGSRGFGRAAAWIVDTPLGSGGAGHRGGRRSGPVDHGHHAAFRLDWFRKVGGYDESFSHNEDAELDHRLRAAGARIWLDAETRVAYAMRDSLGALALQYFRYGRGRARNLLKHRARPRLRQLVPVANLVLVGGCVVAAPLQPWLLLPPLCYAALLGAAGVACAVALRSPAGLWAAPALAVMHNAWALGFLARLLVPTPVDRFAREARSS